MYWTAAGNRLPEYRGKAGIDNRRRIVAQKKRKQRRKEAKKKWGKHSSNGKSNKEIGAKVDNKKMVIPASDVDIDVVDYDIAVDVDVDANVDVDVNVENDKTIHRAHDIMYYLYNPGTKLDLILLNPDTHLTRPCWK